MTEEKTARQRAWTTNGYVEFRPAGKFLRGHAKALETELKKLTKGPRFWPLSQGRKWTCDEVTLSGGKVLISFDTDAEANDEILDEVANDLFGQDGFSGLIGQFADSDYAPNSFETAIYGANREDEALASDLKPLQMVSGDIAWNVGLDPKAASSEEDSNMSITKEQVQILAMLVEGGHKEAAEQLAYGLAEQLKEASETEAPTGDRDVVADPKEAFGPGSEPDWSRDVDRAAQKSYQYLKRTLKGLEAIDYSRSHGGGRNQTSEDAFFNLSFEDGRNVDLVLSVVDNDYDEMHVSTNNVLDYDPHGYMKEIDQDEDVADALKNIRALWAWVGDGRRLKEGSVEAREAQARKLEAAKAGEDQTVLDPETTSNVWSAFAGFDLEEKTPEELTAMMDDGKVDEVVAYLTNEKEAGKEEHDALVLRGKIREKEDYINNKVSHIEIQLPSEDMLMDEPKRFTKKMQKALKLLEAAEKALLACRSFEVL